MDEILERLKSYRVNHLVLLVGGNPLPNWVAARLLLKDVVESTGQPRIIWLLHSDDKNGESSTYEIACRLKILLGKQLFPKSGEPVEYDQVETDAHIRLEAIPSSDNIGINNRLKEFVGRLKGGSIGLNYTGGTKPMAVHVYRFLEKEVCERNSSIFGTLLIFSYLDPRQMALRIEGKNSTGSIAFPLIRNDALRELVSISMVDLAELHGYYPPQTRIKDEWTTTDQNPKIFDLARTIGKTYAEKGVPLKQWYEWLETEPCAPPTREDFSALEEIIQAMDKLAANSAQTPLEKAQALADILKPRADKGFNSLHKWFVGHWLEEYAQASLINAARQSLKTQEGGRNLEFITEVNGRQTDKFELDAALIYGYQLFAISCLTTGADISELLDLQKKQKLTQQEQLRVDKSKERLKEHLMEVFVRAHQLGGDEARVGLVCFYDDPVQLENEIRLSWDTEGKVKVFKGSDFKDLVGAFTTWIKQ